MMNYIVQKFGGTSIGNAGRIEEVVKIITETSKTHKPVISVSAINSYNKNEGTTNKLIEAKNLAQKHGPYIKVIDEIEEMHINLIDELLTENLSHSSAKAQILKIIKNLKLFLNAVEVIHDTSPRIDDIIINTGEKLSAIILSAVINFKGIDAEYVDLTNIVEDNLFSDIDNNFYNFLKEQIADRVKRSSGIPVLTGFFGYVPNGIIKSIGRGYSDLTAALTAAVINAEELQIWKEVDGIYTADPRKVKSARVIEAVTPAEAAELTFYGSEVIHPFTMEQVTKNNIPIRIKNTFAPELPGTLIVNNPERQLKQRSATAVTSKAGIYVLNINSNRMQRAYGFMNRIFEILAHYKIPIDLIATSEVNISLTLEKKYNIDKPLKELEKLGTVHVSTDLAIISLIGEDMKSTVGIALKMISALATKNINIEMISQGASEINISCVIHENKVIDGLNEIHRQILE